MKKLLTIFAIFFSLQSFGALIVTGQLTNTDTMKVGDGTSYVRLTVIYNPTGSVDVLADIYNGKGSYNAGKQPLTANILQVHRTYSLDSATVAGAPSSGLAGLSGKSLIDKMLFWVHQKIATLIVADNPGFTVQVVDIKL